MNKPREFSPTVVAELKALLGERVSTSAAVREHHGKDEFEGYFDFDYPDEDDPVPPEDDGWPFWEPED